MGHKRNKKAAPPATEINSKTPLPVVQVFVGVPPALLPIKEPESAPVSTEDSDKRLTLIYTLCVLLDTKPTDLAKVLHDKYRSNNYEHVVPVQMPYVGMVQKIVTDYMQHPEFPEHHLVMKSSGDEKVKSKRANFLHINKEAYEMIENVAKTLQPKPDYLLDVPLYKLKKLVSSKFFTDLCDRSTPIENILLRNMPPELPPEQPRASTNHIVSTISNVPTAPQDEESPMGNLPLPATKTNLPLDYRDKGYHEQLQAVRKELLHTIEMLQTYPENKMRLAEICGHAHTLQQCIILDRQDIVRQISAAASSQKKEFTLSKDMIKWLTNIIAALDTDAIRSEVATYNKQHRQPSP